MRTERFRSYVLPLVLAALVFRVLVPPDFMMGGGMSGVPTSMCTRKVDKTETLELPDQSGNPHCEHCVTPLLGAPLADLRIDPPSRATPSVLTPVAAQISDTPLVRAQSARAPPLV